MLTSNDELLYLLKRIKRNPKGYSHTVTAVQAARPPQRKDSVVERAGRGRGGGSVDGAEAILLKSSGRESCFDERLSRLRGVGERTREERRKKSKKRR